MGDITHTKQNTTKSSNGTREETTSSHKGTQSAIASSHLPLYTMAWGNHPPPGLSLEANFKTKRSINNPGEVYEQQADPVTEQVMRLPNPTSPNVSDIVTNSPETSTVSPIVDEALHSPGQPLDINTRTFMESRLGYDLGHVHLHTSSHDAEAAKAVQARAFTVGQDIVLDANENIPGSPQYQRLIAHELVHTIQQRSDIPSHLKLKREVSMPTDPAEIEADAIATKVVDQSQIEDGTISKARPPVHTLTQHKLVQRQQKTQAASPEDVAKQKLITKFKLGRIYGEHGKEWTLAELASADEAFSKMSSAEQTSLKGVDLIRTDKVDIDQFPHGGEFTWKTEESRSGKKTVHSRLYIADLAFSAKQPQTAGDKPKAAPSSFPVFLHEAGHAIASQAEREAYSAQYRLSPQVIQAQKAFNDEYNKIISPEKYGNDPDTNVRQYIMTFYKAATALDALRTSGADQIANLKAAAASALQKRNEERDVVRSLSPASHAVKDFEPMAKLQDHWFKVARELADTRARIVAIARSPIPLKKFLDIVNDVKNKGQHKLAPITPYAAQYPDKPVEFFAEAYALWLTNPTELESKAKPLKEWFDKGMPLQ